MHLKRLQLTGFKTFADRTEILFSPGVTAIVGPNGSGKSNIADAVLWALGEQKASAVRGVRNQDVIFNGSAKRKQTGLAEVSLTVDNSDGTLPLAFNEVTITRRALRSGESDYFINKTACRLKDIYELFLDTGVGREAYALVNQSEIDAVLTAAPESRRGLFEEAAGIKKYRVKKREALRKLEATELNLSRITDILSEIGSQLAPLHLQAETARRFLQLKKQLTHVEENYLIVELRKANEQLQAARSSKQSNESLAVELAEKLAEAELRSAELTAKVGEVESVLDIVRSEHNDLRTKNERLNNDRRLSLERLQALSAQEDLHQRELSELIPRLDEIRNRVEQLEIEFAQTGEQSGDRFKALGSSEDHLRRLNEQVIKLQAAVEHKRNDAVQLARKRAAEEGEMARAEARLSEAKSNASVLEQERGVLEREQLKASAAISEAEQTLSTADQERSKSEHLTSEGKDKKRQLSEQLTKTRQQFETIRGEGLAISVRRRSLQELEDSQEGYFAGVKAVVNAAKNGRLSGRYLVVADSFTAPGHLVTALETAFGSSLQDIITDTEDAAKSAIDYLKNGSYGRATFLPLSRMKGSRSDLRPGTSPGRGFLGSAIDLIQFAPDLRPALEALIGRALICETLDDAIDLSHSASGWSRIVTVGGEVVTPSGAITGGSVNRRGSSLLERKSEIARLQSALIGQQKDEENAERELARAQADLKEAERAGDTLAEQAAEFRLQATAARQSLERAKRDSQLAADRLITFDGRIATAFDTVRLAEARVKTCASILQSLEGQTDNEFDTADLVRLRELLADRETLTVQITQERISRAALDEKSSGIVKALRLAKSELELLTAQKEKRLALIAQTVADHATVAELFAKSSSLIDDSDASVTAAYEKLSAQLATRQAVAAELATATIVLRQHNNSRADVLAAARRSELAEARFEMAVQQVAARLLEEYDVAAERALAFETTPELPADCPREVARLRREIKQLGDVNVAAIEEFDRLSERFSHMSAQKEDAQLAKEKVYFAIREIDESTRDVFMKTFHEVEAAFQTIFDRLFNGGSAQLKLTSPEDLLETGIEILVQLPGKKQQNLQLLSGGERALTAVALLFAFLKVRPAPFCLLDEVDAPLDGANIERFADLMREFGLSTQFLVITHNPATMEAASVWYGVTMQEPGISRILSLQVPQTGQAA